MVQIVKFACDDNKSKNNESNRKHFDYTLVDYLVIEVEITMKECDY